MSKVKGLKLKIDIGTFAVFEETYGSSFFGLDDEEKFAIKALATLVYAAAYRGNSPVTLDDIFNFNVKEFEEVMKLLEEAMKPLGNEMVMGQPERELFPFKFDVEGDNK